MLNSQHIFTKGKPCLVDPFTFFTEVNAYLDWNVVEGDNLGILIDQSYKPSKQRTVASDSTNRNLGYSYSNIEYKSKCVIMSLYRSFIRPYLE